MQINAQGDYHMSRRRNYHRGSYEEYEHSDQELYVDDQCCGNCCYYEGGYCMKPDTSDYADYYDDEEEEYDGEKYDDEEDDLDEGDE